jgi:hypothetical protein
MASVLDNLAASSPTKLRNVCRGIDIGPKFVGRLHAAIGAVTVSGLDRQQVGAWLQQAAVER